MTAAWRPWDWVVKNQVIEWLSFLLPLARISLKSQLFMNQRARIKWGEGRTAIGRLVDRFAATVDLPDGAGKRIG